jgi:hypothetical protein
VIELGALEWVVGVAACVFRQRLRHAKLTRGLRSEGGRDQPSRARGLLDRQARGVLEGTRAGARTVRRARDRLQGHRGRFVRTDGGERSVPGPARFGRPVQECLGERVMRGAALRRRRLRIGDGTDQRVTECQGVAADGDHTRGLGRRVRFRLDPGDPAGSHDRVQVIVVVRGRECQGGP